MERLHGGVAISALEKKSLGPLMEQLDRTMARHQLLRERAKLLERGQGKL